MTAPYLGDYKEDDTLYFAWSSNDANGASITRATNGTISVYKDGGTTQSTAGVTDTEDFDALTGIHAVTIDLSADAFYATGSDYYVVLSAATIDGQTVNAVLAHFSIQNRYEAAPSAATIADAVWDEVITTGAHNDANSAGKYLRQIKQGIAAEEATVNDGAPTTTSFVTSLTSSVDDFYNDRTLTFVNGSSLAGQSRIIKDYDGATKTVTLDEALTSAPSNGDEIQVQSDHVHTTEQIADVILRRTLTNVQASADGDTIDIESLYGAICAAVRQSISGGVGTVLNPDSTTLGTLNYTGTAGADPITAVTPGA